VSFDKAAFPAALCKYVGGHGFLMFPNQPDTVRIITDILDTVIRLNKDAVLQSRQSTMSSNPTNETHSDDKPSDDKLPCDTAHDGIATSTVTNNNNNNDGRLVEKETRQEGGVKMGVYHHYIQANGGYFLVDEYHSYHYNDAIGK
jgi:hypothetical protein